MPNWKSCSTSHSVTFCTKQIQSMGWYVTRPNRIGLPVLPPPALRWRLTLSGLSAALCRVPLPWSERSQRCAFSGHSPHGPEPDATGYQGFYYHFLDMQTGRRAWQCELSTVDSALLLAGALTAGSYFDAETADEQEIRTLADALYRRADWQWAQNRVCNGHTRMAARNRIPQLPVGRLRRGTAAVHPGPGLADPSAARGQLRSVGIHVSMEAMLWI